MLFSAKLHLQSWCGATQRWYVISAFSLSAPCLLRNEIECSVAPACFIPDAESYIHNTAYVCQHSVIICIAAKRSFEKRSTTGALQSRQLSQCFMRDTCYCTTYVCVLENENHVGTFACQYISFICVAVCSTKIMRIRVCAEHTKNDKNT